MGVKFNHLCYGGDYNPDQWLEYPEILEEDIRLMKQNWSRKKVYMILIGWKKLSIVCMKMEFMCFLQLRPARVRTGWQTVIRKCFV